MKALKLSGTQRSQHDDGVIYYNPHEYFANVPMNRPRAQWETCNLMHVAKKSKVEPHAVSMSKF